MGNSNSASYSKAKGVKGAKVVSTEPQHVPMQRKLSTRAEKVPMQMKPSTKAEKVRLGEYPDQPHGENPLVNDDTISKYIQSAKHKLRSFSSIGRRHEEQRNPLPAPLDVANVNDSNKENERDEFSDFIQNARKKLRTVSTMGKNNSFKKGKDSGR